ncbi:MAG: hypothetical protein CVV18_05165 [Gammaproteobacteria bacterium HGW-Gammaproteobacteria-8]|nr:MAG: hypothetical protein CVV18_05165 [Gammaproteobacteria bacterium HGW-Gammaproteobacteria-8]
MDTGRHDDHLLWEHEVVFDPAHLQLGHFVSRLDRPWIGSPFSLAGVMLSRQSQINWFRNNCNWVVVDLLRSRTGTEAGSMRPGAASASRPTWKREASNPAARINVLRRAELDTAIVDDSLDGHALILRQADLLIDAIARNGSVRPEDARVGVRRIAGRLEKNLAAMVWLTRIKNTDRYTAEHCVNVAILGMGLAQALGWESEQVEHAGMAGMLHDLGKLKLDLQILNKPGRLTPEEYEHVKQHARFGFEMLHQEGDVDPAVARAVLEHHERPDGNGYPQGLVKGAQLELSALISVVDAYDAITSRRPYSQPRSHHEALGILWKERGRQFAAEMVEALIQFLGWITPGTLVRLSSEQYAVVLKASQQHRLWPRVRLLEPEGERYVPGSRVDLSEHNHEHPDTPIRVAEVLTGDALKVDLRAVLEQEGGVPAEA